MISFEQPLFLLTILPWLVYCFFAYKNRFKNTKALFFPSTNVFKTTQSTPRNKLKNLPFFLRVTSILFFIVALANPTSRLHETPLTAKGIEIMICLDISESMRASDLKPNRLEVAKKNILSFINKRKTDKIGLVVFGNESFLQCPLTLDHSILGNFLQKVDFIKELGTSTAIGMSMASAIVALKTSDTKTKIIILLTDGINNSGDIDPITAAKLCETYGMKIYSIGIGKPGISQVLIEQNHPVFGKRYVPVKNEMDETTLKEMAKITSGAYFNVQNQKGFKEAYEEIDSLEKTTLNAQNYWQKKEEYAVFVWIGFILLLLEIVLTNTFLRRLP